MQCIDTLLGICLVTPRSTASVFGFKDFVAALALLIIIYTVSDIRYRFRVSVAPTRLYGISYSLISVIGFGTLLTDIWINEKWPVPDSLITVAVWQGTLATLFLGLVVTWMYYAFIRPPIFGRNNFKKYSRELYRLVLKGSESELPTIAHELGNSAKSLVTYAARLKEVQAEENGKLKSCAEGYANDMLLLIANRRFCRHLVASSPMTAVRFVEAVTDSNAYHVPIGLFLQNVSTEAIRNKDSSLYHEDEGYSSGLLGYIKPFSRAIYGNYKLVESLQHHSPLDINYKSVWAWDADQFEAYCRVVLITLQGCLEGGYWGWHPSVLFGAIHEIRDTTKRAIVDIKNSAATYPSDAWSRLSVGVGFIRDSINAIGRLQPPPKVRTLRVRDRPQSWPIDEDLYDQIAEAMFEIIHSAAYVEGPPDNAWAIHHNSVWSPFFDYGESNRAWKVVQFKLRRLLFDEIRRLETLPNYKSARVLGICLNVMGLKIGKRSGYGHEYAALKSAVLSWTGQKYLNLRKVNADVADACLIGGISFDAEQAKLVKTYLRGLKAEPDREYLPLR